MIFLRRIIFIYIIIFIFCIGIFGQTIAVKSDNIDLLKIDSLYGNKSSVQEILIYESIIKDIEANSKNSEALAPLLSKLGGMYFSMECYPLALKAYARSVIIRDKNRDKIPFTQMDLGWHLIEMGNSLFKLGNYKYAEYPFQLAYNAFSTQKNRAGVEGMITANNNIGLCLLNSNMNHKAIQVFKNSLYISEKIADSSRIFMSNIYISMCFMKMHKFDKSISIFTDEKIIQLVPSKSYANLFRITYLGNIYMNIGREDLALNTYMDIVEFYPKPEFAIIIVDACFNLANIYFKKNNLEAAKNFAIKGKSILINKINHSAEINIDKLLYRIYKKQKNFEKALIYYESYIKHKEILTSLNTLSFVEDYNKKIEKIKIENEIEKIENQNKRAEIEKRNQWNLSFFMIALTAVLLIMVFSGKGFSQRIDLIEEYFMEFDIFKKLISLILLLGYFIFFYLFFMPVVHTFEILQFSFIKRLLPGILAFIISVVMLAAFFVYEKKRKEKDDEKDYKKYIIFFISLISVVILFESLLFANFGLGGFSFVISISILVLASFITPFYLILVIVERLIINRMEEMTINLAKEPKFKGKYDAQKDEIVTILSEKTNGKIIFDINELAMVEAQGNYCMFVVVSKNKIIRKLLHTTIKSVESQLSKHPYIMRCHKSFLVNIQNVSKLNGNSRGYYLVFSDNIEPVPISRSFQNDILQFIEKNSDKKQVL